MAENPKTIDRTPTRTGRPASLSQTRKDGKPTNSRKQTLKKKKIFIYQVKRGGKIVEGYQNAYNRQEVLRNLQRLGFQVKSVRRYYDFKFRAPSNEIIGFVSTSARLLEQKLPYGEVLQIMSNNTKNSNMKNALRTILLDLKNGIDSREAFIRQGKIFGPHVALMLGIASKSGDMTSIFRNIAALVERQAEFKKSLVSAMIMPAITSVTVLGAIVFYAVYLVPKMMHMLGDLVDETPSLTALTMQFSTFAAANYVWITIVGLALLIGAYSYLLTERGKLFRDMVIIRIPYLGGILRNTSTEIFCRVLSIMYTSSSENIEAIQIAAEASGNRYLTHRIRTVTVPSMLKYGTELGKAMAIANFFPDIFLSRFSTASDTGSVKETAEQLADYYKLENQFALKNLLSMIEIAITIIIMAALVFLTLLSTETASININPTM